MSAHRTVVLSAKAYRNLQTFAAFAGKSLDKAADKAINEWMESTGQTIIDFVEACVKRCAPDSRTKTCGWPRNGNRTGFTEAYWYAAMRGRGSERVPPLSCCNQRSRNQGEGSLQPSFENGVSF